MRSASPAKPAGCDPTRIRGWAADTITALAELGVPLSLDDFGTGYSSLVHLKRLPVEEIKIDASFVGRMADNADDAVIVRSIIDLARALGLRSIAEGVETAETLRTLREMGCDAAQGWHFSEAMDADAATAWLTSRVAASPALRVIPGAGAGTADRGSRLTRYSDAGHPLTTHRIADEPL